MSKSIPGNHKHMTQDNRVTIEKGLDNRTSLRKIAESIGKDPSTVSKEMGRICYIAKLHDQMPVVLPGEIIMDWIQPDGDPAKLVKAALTDMVFEKANM